MEPLLDVLVTGSTGYIAARLIPELAARGHRVCGLARPQSLSRVPRGASPVAGDALDARSVGAALRAGDTVVHLVGTPHPSPGKAAEFRRVDLPSILATVDAATRAGVAHLVYVSVAHPAPVMREYIAVRTRGEAAIRDSGIPATIVRPWYVLGPGHRWPVFLVPVYACARLVPALRDGAERLGLVTLDDMVRSLVEAVEHRPARGVRIVDVPAIRAARAERVQTV